MPARAAVVAGHDGVRRTIGIGRNGQQFDFLVAGAGETGQDTVVERRIVLREVVPVHGKGLPGIERYGLREGAKIGSAIENTAIKGTQRAGC